MLHTIGRRKGQWNARNLVQFLCFLVFGSKVSWFCGFKVSWFQSVKVSFLIPKFQSFKDSMIPSTKTFISGSFIGNDLISKIFKIC